MERKENLAKLPARFCRAELDRRSDDERYNREEELSFTAGELFSPEQLTQIASLVPAGHRALELRISDRLVHDDFTVYISTRDLMIVLVSRRDRGPETARCIYCEEWSGWAECGEQEYDPHLAFKEMRLTQGGGRAPGADEHDPAGATARAGTLGANSPLAQLPQ